MALNKQWLFDINCKEANKLKINKLEKFNYFPNVIKSAQGRFFNDLLHSKLSAD